MTEIEKCINWLNDIRDNYMENEKRNFDMAVEALLEIQQYRAIGTVEECWEAREKQWVKDIIHNPDGGVDKDWLCPTCGKFCSPYSKHCQNCGQAVKVDGVQ